ncbi:hypothetical protein PSYAE_03142 [Pseudomonas amygdali pv. aesculi str. 0893_23]|uniref:hypothetical protein n=1 Tax=Pseudomonas syringae group genomosp. 2 TaxID=251698 RepID=UPI0001CC4112|nr:MULTISPECIES: hypothetical protein [Pseudomonas syringae group genomosp. 2]EGH00961.1 hypothetical protein PSYAE_03142 [Pseudomonas amygdali pv. aesculi str. 0893_23]KPW08188.1 Uncharacterized protein ALO90_02917 [Pseudomonas amygdali pv. aesculi]MCQ3009872.1 hypothetical protein [Pseudomonas savastanoi]
MNHQERFTRACQVADFESHPGTLGGYKVWDVEVVKGDQGISDGPYFTEAEAEIAAELWCTVSDRRRARARASIHCSAWNPDPARELAIRKDAMAARMILAELIGADIPKPTAPRP